MDVRLEDEPLGYLMYRVANALRGDVTATVLDPLNLTFPQYICLRLVSRFPDRSNAELARAAAVSPQAMNTVVRDLQERGLIARPASVESGRALPARLTRAGEDLVKRTDAGVRSAERRLMSGLTDAQRREFKRVLAALGAD